MLLLRRMPLFFLFVVWVVVVLPILTFTYAFVPCDNGRRMSLSSLSLSPSSSCINGRRSLVQTYRACPNPARHNIRGLDCPRIRNLNWELYAAAKNDPWTMWQKMRQKRMEYEAKLRGEQMEEEEENDNANVQDDEEVMEMSKSDIGGEENMNTLGGQNDNIDDVQPDVVEDESNKPDDSNLRIRKSSSSVNSTSHQKHDPSSQRRQTHRRSPSNVKARSDSSDPLAVRERMRQARLQYEAALTQSTDLDESNENEDDFERGEIL